MSNEFNPEIGNYRPIYLWGGPGTVRMNKLKFMDVRNDVQVHLDAHKPQGAKCVVDDLYCNWIHLMYDWGFPAEVEVEDWESFRDGAQTYHDLGHKVFAYIQSSNCVFDGTHIQQDWYARNAAGNKTHYFTFDRRFMACLAHPAWQEHIRSLVKGAIERGADGIFLDNLFQGEYPMSMFGAWLGTTGCHCENCQRTYYERSGEHIPTRLVENDPNLQQYLEFRASQVTQLVDMVREYANQLQPGTPISCNDFDPILRNSYLNYGIDISKLANVQDIVMIENFGLPLWTPTPQPRLANNALTVRNARVMVKNNAHLDVLSYDVGIGFDPVYSPRQYQQGIAEASALGVTMTTKGTEYHDGTQMTLLTDPQYAEVHQAIGRYHRWLEQNTYIYAQRTNVSPIGVAFPGNTLWIHWLRLAQNYFDVQQTLTTNGLPWQIVDLNDGVDPIIDTLIVISPQLISQIPSDYNGKVIKTYELPSWQPSEASRIATHPTGNRLITFVLNTLMKAYTVNRFFRWFFDKLQLAKTFTQSPFYFIPPQAKQDELLSELSGDMDPSVSAQEPVLIDYWSQGGNHQIHLVNYSTAPQQVTISLPWEGSTTLITPDEETTLEISGQNAVLMLNIYAIITQQ